MSPRSTAAVVLAVGALGALVGLAPAAAGATVPRRDGAILVTLNDFQHAHHGTGNAVIRALSPTGGKPRTLLNCVQYAGRCPGQVLRPEISPNGKTIAFSGVYVTDTETFQSKITLLRFGSHKLTTVRFTSHDSTEQDSDPAWFPDSTGLVFGVHDAAGPVGLFTESSNGADQHKISSCACSEPSVSPLGGTILVDRGRSLWTIGSDGSQPHTFASRGEDGSWAPNARHVAFATPGAHGNIVIEAAHGGAPRTVVKDGADPVFSPSGKQIAFERTVGGRHHGVTEILTVPVAGGRTHLLMRVGRSKIGVGGITWRAVS